MSSYDEHLISMAGGDGELDLDAIQARADAATEGPYVLARYDHGGGRMFAQTASGERGVLVADTFRVGDREFIAAALADVLALLALVRSQQAKIERVEALHKPTDAVMYSGSRQHLVKVCTGCGTDDGNWQRYPCPTIAAYTTTDDA